MFDTPDLKPLCIAPILAVFAGMITFGIIQLLGNLANKQFISKFSKIFNCLTLLVSTMMILVACVTSVSLGIGSSSPAPWFRPREKQVIGNWQISPPTLHTLENRYDLTIPSHEIVFNQDGTFYFRNIPDFSIHPNNALEFISTSGSWYLTQIEGTQRLESIVVATTDDDEDETRFRFYFEGSLPPYTLIPLDSAFRYRFQE